MPATASKDPILPKRFGLKYSPRAIIALEYEHGGKLQMVEMPLDKLHDFNNESATVEDVLASLRSAYGEFIDPALVSFKQLTRLVTVLLEEARLSGSFPAKAATRTEVTLEKVVVAAKEKEMPLLPLKNDLRKTSLPKLQPLEKKLSRGAEEFAYLTSDSRKSSLSSVTKDKQNPKAGDDDVVDHFEDDDGAEELGPETEDFDSEEEEEEEEEEEDEEDNVAAALRSRDSRGSHGHVEDEGAFAAPGSRLAPLERPDLRSSGSSLPPLGGSLPPLGVPARAHIHDEHDDDDRRDQVQQEERHRRSQNQDGEEEGEQQEHERDKTAQDLGFEDGDSSMDEEIGEEEFSVGESDHAGSDDEYF